MADSFVCVLKLIGMEEFIDLPIIPLDATQDRYTYHFFKLLHDRTFIKQLTFKILIENLKQIVLPEVLSIHLSIHYQYYLLHLSLFVILLFSRINSWPSCNGITCTILEPANKTSTSKQNSKRERR